MKAFLTRHKRLLLGLLEYSLLLAASWLIYRLWARPAAIEFRGNTAIGGEICVFALPLVWGALKCGIKDIKDGIFKLDSWGWE
ncbi:MAG: hypothetical protein IKZ82_08350 [Clostridia bacterium]|nr:hypothetical protein [Clostridia bacterium]